MSHWLLLRGCRPQPLASYLSALGVLRLVAEQADSGACGHWTATGFVLMSRLDDDELETFLLDDYRPSPVISPWNGGSGFDKGSKGPEALQRVRDSVLPRLEDYRTTIRAAERILAGARDAGLTKEQLVSRCRSAFPDAALPWLDAAVVLGGARGVEYPPLLGTGGNDGRLDFSVAFLGRVAEVLGLLTGRAAPSRARSRSWLRAALQGSPSDPLPAETPGQFAPGALGGVGAGPGADDARTNPWQFVLLIEGALVFAAAAARRLGAGAAGRAVMPFTFDVTNVGHASSTEEDARAELWMPLWDHPATFAEVDRVLSEGRSSWRGRQARSGLDAARAATTLGVDRGLSAFVRYGLLTRNGLATLAVPLGRVQVSERAVPAVRLAAQADVWVSRIAAAESPPAAVQAGLRRVTSAQLALAQAGEGPASGRALLAVLVALAELEQALGRSRGFRSTGRLSPLPSLRALEWLPLLDQPPGFWLAASFASLRDSRRQGLPCDRVDALATQIRPVSRSEGRLQFTEEAGLASEVPGVVGLLSVLAARREELRADRVVAAGLGQAAQVGSSAWYDAGLFLRVGDAQSLLDGRLDEVRLAELLGALALLDWSDAGPPPREDRASPGVELSLLLPFQTGKVVRRRGSEQELAMRPGRGWARRLRGGDVPGVLTEASLRLRLAGAAPLPEVTHLPRDERRGMRLAALTLGRVGVPTAAWLLDLVDPPEVEETGQRGAAEEHVPITTTQEEST